MKKKLCIISIVIISMLCISSIASGISVDEEAKKIINSIEISNKNKISNFDINKYIMFMDSNNKIPEKNLLLAYSEIDDVEKSKNILERNVKLFNKNTDINTRLLTIELLSNIYIESGDEKSAINLIKESIKEISIKDYRDNAAIILEFLEKFIDITNNYNLGIELTEYILLKNEKLTDKANLLFKDQLRTLYILVNNYAKASELAVKSIVLSNKVEDKYKQAKSMIELSVLFKRLKGFETGTKLVNEALKIEIENKSENADVKTYGYISICELYLSINDYKNAKKISDKIPLYEKYFSKEDYRDIEILKNNIDARIYIAESKLEMAEKCLDKAIELNKIDKQEFYIDKETAIELSLGNLSASKNEYDKAKSIYIDLLSKSESKKDYYMYEKVLKSLIEVEKDSNTKNIYYARLNSLMEYEQDKRYGDYTYNILDKVKYESEMIESNNFKINTYKILLISILFVVIVGGYINKKMSNIKYINTQDVLTNAYNRRAFDKKYSQLLSRNKKFSIIIMDLDNFKNINDTFGHKFGDIVLINTCKVIKNTLDKDSELFRYGGEEFVIISKNKSSGDVFELAEKIRKKIEAMVWDENIKVTISIGISNSEYSKENIIENADENLYISKKTGKNKVTDDMQNNIYDKKYS